MSELCGSNTGRGWHAGPFCRNSVPSNRSGRYRSVHCMCDAPSVLCVAYRLAIAIEPRILTFVCRAGRLFPILGGLEHIADQETDSMNVDHALEARLIHMRRNSRLLLAVANHSGCATSGRLQTRIAPVADVVWVNRIQLVDASGRAGLDLRRNTAAIGMFVVDESGGTRSGVAQFSHGGGRLALHGPDMEVAAVLHLKGSGSLTFCDEAGQ